MKQAIYYTLTASCLWCLLAFQHPIDLASLSCDEFDQYIRNTSVAKGDFDQTILQYDTLRQLSLSKKDTACIAKALNNIAEIHLMRGDLIKSKTLFLASLNYAIGLKDKNSLGGNYNRLANLYKKEGQLDSAFYYLKKSKKLVDNNLVNDAKKRTYFNYKASIYEDLGQGDSAIYSYLQMIEFVDPKQEHILGSTWSAIGYTFAERMNHNKALVYYDKALEVLSSEKNPSTVCSISVKKATSLLHQKRINEAKQLIIQVLDLQNTRTIKSSWEKANTLLATIYIEEKQYEKAAQIIDMLRAFAIKNEQALYPRYYFTKIKLALLQNDLHNLPTYFDQLRQSINQSEILLANEVKFAKLQAQYYEKLGNTKAANTALNRYVVLYDSMYQMAQSNITQDLEIHYQTKLKEQEITLLHTKNELAATHLTTSRKQLMALGIGLLLLTTLLYRVFRLNTKLESAVEQKNVLLKEIHHRVKNNLQFISSLLSLQSEHVKDPSAVKALQEGQNRVRTMGLIHQKLYQKDNLTKIEAQDYFQKLTENLFNSYNINPNKIALALDIEAINLDVDTAIPLGLLVNELMSNALKHAFPANRSGIIKIGLKEEKNQLHLSVADNGIGLKKNNETQLTSSFGYKLIHAFKTQLEGDLSIQSEQGTQVNLQIREYKKVI